MTLGYVIFEYYERINFIIILLYNAFRFEHSSMFETPPLLRGITSGKDRQLAPKRDLIDPFEGLGKYGINTGNTTEENSVFKKRKR